LRGPLLIEAQKWYDHRSQDLSDQERKFISASLEQREQLSQEEKERQQRELAKAEERRQEQAAAAKSLRRLAWALATVALVAFGAAFFGFWQKNQAETRKRAAEVANAEAKRQEAIATKNSYKERISRNAAEEQARIAESRRLAAESSSALVAYLQRSLLLATESVKIEQSLHGMRLAAAEQSLRKALAIIGGPTTCDRPSENKRCRD
jgi:hypothetical protein